MGNGFRDHMEMKQRGKYGLQTGNEIKKDSEPKKAKSSQPKVNVQNIFLNALRVSRTKVTAFTSSGAKLTGVIRGYDEFTIVLEHESKQTLVYKSNIVSICPSTELKPIKDDTLI